MEDRPALYKFGPYQLDPAKRLLLRDGITLPIAPKTFDLLQLLVEEIRKYNQLVGDPVGK